MKIAIHEALRYAGVPNAENSELTFEMQETARQMEKQLTPKTCWKVFDLIQVDALGNPVHKSLSDDPNQTKNSVCGFQLAGTDIVLSGRTARTMLAGCEKVVVAAGTLGLPFEKQLAAYSASNMKKALLYDACGSAAVESVMDELEEEIIQKAKGWYLTDRFSCGYGDLPLSFQKDFSDLLEMPKKIGVYTNASNMMMPTKSVSALIGLSKTRQPARVRGCSSCSFAEKCELKKKGNYCGI